jgi:hypothetical protein
MNAKPILARRPIGTTLVAAALSTLVAIGLLSTVSSLFLRDGAPLEQAAIAERACADYAFVSERETCMRTLAASRARIVASEPGATPESADACSLPDEHPAVGIQL